MKKVLIVLLCGIMILAAAVIITACGGNKTEEAEPVPETSTEQQEEPEDEAEPEPAKKAVKTIEAIDEDLGPREPLQIESITLYDDGSVELIPIEDLKKNEIKDEDTTALYPFEEFGKVKDVYVVDYGNGGYRTVLALMKNGTICAINGRALVEDHIIAVMDNVSGRENFTSIENRTDDSGTVIIGITDENEEVVLDYSLNFK